MDIRTNEFEFTPKSCEEIDACIKVPCDPRGVISGRILDCCNKPIRSATLKLFEKTCKDELCPLTHTFTDENGLFLFGPLCPCTTYVIKIFVNEVKNKQIKIDHCKCVRDMDCLECTSDFKCGCKCDCKSDDCYDDDYDYDDYDYDDYEDCSCNKKKSTCYDDYEDCGCNCDKKKPVCREKKECSCKNDKWDWKKESRLRKAKRNRCECDCDCFDDGCDF